MHRDILYTCIIVVNETLLHSDRISIHSPSSIDSGCHHYQHVIQRCLSWRQITSLYRILDISSSNQKMQAFQYENSSSPPVIDSGRFVTFVLSFRGWQTYSDRLLVWDLRSVVYFRGVGRHCSMFSRKHLARLASRCIVYISCREPYILRHLLFLVTKVLWCGAIKLVWTLNDVRQNINLFPARFKASDGGTIKVVHAGPCADQRVSARVFARSSHSGNRELSEISYLLRILDIYWGTMVLRLRIG